MTKRKTASLALAGASMLALAAALPAPAAEVTPRSGSSMPTRSRTTG